MSPTGTATPTATASPTVTPGDQLTGNSNGNAGENGRANGNGGENGQVTGNAGENSRANGNSGNNSGPIGSVPEDEQDPEDEIKDSMEDESLESQLTQAARVLESQQSFEYKPFWHGPYDVYPHVRKLYTYKENEESFVLVSSQLSVGSRSWNNPKFILVNLTQSTIQSYTLPITDRVVRAKYLGDDVFRILTRNDEKVYDINIAENSFKESKASSRSMLNVKSKEIDYRILLDRVTPDLQNPNSLLWFKQKKTAQSWRNVELQTYHVIRRVRSIHAEGDHLVLLMDRGLVQDHREIKVDNLSFRAVHYKNQDPGKYLVSAQGSVYELLEDQPINIWLQNLFDNQQQMNPVPFLSASEKLRSLIVMNEDNGVSLVGKKRFGGNISVSLDFLEKVSDLNDISFGSHRDGLKANNHYYTLTVIDKKTYIVKYSSDFIEMDRKEVAYRMRSGRISEVDGRIYLISRKQMTAMDEGLNILWQKRLTGKISYQLGKLPNGKLIGMAQSYIVMIDPNDGVMKGLFSVADLDIKNARQVVLIDDKLYLNYSDSKIFEINLPYHEIAL